jgi:hypothetical protein
MGSAGTLSARTRNSPLHTAIGAMVALDGYLVYRFRKGGWL